MKEQVKNSLVVLQERKLQTKALESECKKIISALEGIEKNTWKYAVSIHQILVKDLWVKDFEKLENLADYLQTSRSTLVKMKKAVDFALDKGVMGIWSVSRCYVLSTIEDYDTFQKWCKDNHIEVDKISKNDLEKLVSDYNKGRNKAVNDNEEKEKEEIESIEIVYNKVMYRIPLNVLKKYEVKEK